MRDHELGKETFAFMANSFIPNSFQTPNAYVDTFMAYLTNAEWKVLSYTIRRIFGFNKRQDRISLTRYAEGTKNAEGEYLDRGTGLSISAISTALSFLVRCNLIIVVEGNNPQNEGVCYTLQLDFDRVDMGLLVARQEEMLARNRERTEKARSSVGQNAALLSDRTLPFCPTEPQYTEGNPVENHISAAAESDPVDYLGEDIDDVVFPEPKKRKASGRIVSSKKSSAAAGPLTPGSAKPPSPKKPSAYSSTAIFDCIAQEFWGVRYDDEDKSALEGGRIGMIREFVVERALKGLQATDLDENQIGHVCAHISSMKKWFLKECANCDLKSVPKFKEYWLKYLKSADARRIEGKVAEKSCENCGGTGFTFATINDRRTAVPCPICHKGE